MSADPRVLVRQAIDANVRDLDQQSRLVIGVSGGPDSVALARGVVGLGRPAVAVVIDHGLQEGSAAIARSASELCRQVGVGDVRVVRVEVPVGPGAGGLESAARGVRRAALEAVAAEVGASAVLLGHTRDDQAETVLLRLARGSGARSLAAMSAVTGLWRRPLLTVPRASVRASVADLDTWDDPHNDDARFARVRVRQSALPALVDAVGPAVVEGLSRSAALLRDDADALDDWTDLAYRQCRGDGQDFDVAGLEALPRAVRTRVLRRAAVEAGCPPTDLTADHVDRLDALITRWRGQGAVDLPGGIAGSRECGRVVLARIPPVAMRRQQREET